MPHNNWNKESLVHCLIGSSLRNKSLHLSHDDLRSVNKALGMIPMKDRVKGNTVDRCKIVKKDWFAYNPMRLNIGSICRWQRDEECLVSPDYVVFQCNPEKLDAEFFDQFRRSHAWDDFMSRAGNGSVRVRIYLKDLAPLKINLPPIDEQRRIAQILLTWDQAISTAESLVDKSMEQRKALMQKLLSGKERFPEFKGEWKKVLLGDIATLTAGGTPSTKKPEYWGGEIPWMNSGDINLRKIFEVEGRITQLGLSESSAKEIPKDSVLIALAGQGKTRGTVAINRIKLCTNQSIAAILPNTNVISAEYLFFNLDSRYQEIRSMSTGDGGRGGLNLSILKSIEILVPLIEEQIKIKSILNLIDDEIDILNKKILLLKQEKRALMQQLLTGKKRVKV